jgi:hypothetical protein
MAKKAAPKKSAVKKAAPKKSATKKAAPKKSAPKKSGAKAAAPKKKAAAVKLNEKQSSLLSKVRGAGMAGYHADKGEGASLNSLQTKKLLKKGKKDKVTGKTPFHITKAGEKHLSTGGGSLTGGNA